MSLNHLKPSLRALEVFESAARMGGFTSAGNELGITQSAVSRQVGDLEAMLDVTLFQRRGAHVTVTPTGKRLADTPTGKRLAERLAVALKDMRAAVSEAARSDGMVTLSMLPSVAAKWFAPRLGRFVTAHPQIDLRVSASRHLVDFEVEGVDAAIRYGRGSWPGLAAQKLASETVSPVCTPSYAERLGLSEPEDLIQATLLYGDIPEDWEAWFAVAGCAENVPPGPRLGDDAAILQAVLDHQGVALGRSRLIEDDLESGKLVTPFDIRLSASHAY
ncbi:LysR substrate-binding domain-containing protein [Parasedimentitalea huanghaiensis]|uniref:LysR family transcriptional regulator n=1 Tax=Parasedimentitalea huanghaiensis TaxID=2682100 RepID=A0A6L6WAJ5_9RHOB|nr:LysR substrate-binding domain-containing protein [Zongyanglinia huanghaiensis]MVO14278.1 LysR family transcriptional regulator [Zongyanglinia huanghaiensis]